MSAVDEDLSPGQDHIYVVFLLPVLEPGRHRGRGAWGADAAAASLMGLSGHSYAARGTPLPCVNPLLLHVKSRFPHMSPPEEPYSGRC